MSTTPITNIYHPDNATPAQDVTTLGAMADSIETAMLNLPRKFADFTALEAWTPANGALAFVQADGRTYQRESNTWRPIQARHVIDTASGRTYFGTGDNAWNTGSTYMGMSPASETGSGLAAWISYDGSEVFRVYKSGNARVYGDLQVDGGITLGSNTPWTTLPLASGFTGSLQYCLKGNTVEARFDISGTISTDTAITGALPTAFRPSTNRTGIEVIPSYIDPSSARPQSVIYLDAGTGVLRGTSGGGGTSNISRIRGVGKWLTVSG